MGFTGIGIGARGRRDDDDRRVAQMCRSGHDEPDSRPWNLKRGLNVLVPRHVLYGLYSI
jgi:hypothetical protein